MQSFKMNRTKVYQKDIYIYIYIGFFTICFMIRIRSTPSLPLFPGPLWPGVVTSDMG